jgi:hypothetical protein
MKTAPHWQFTEGTAIVAITVFALPEILALASALSPDRPLAGSALAGAATAIVVLVVAYYYTHRAVHGSRPPADMTAGGEWFSARALEGFPMEALRPLLHRPDPPSLSRPYTAWILATHGHDAWIAHHLDLPPGIARLLTDTAHRRRRPGLPPPAAPYAHPGATR